MARALSASNCFYPHTVYVVVPCKKILNLPVALTQQYLFCQAKGQPIRRVLKIGLVSADGAQQMLFICIL